ncbi:phosphoadenylyl-sulfate reductase [Jannaschia seohaensis]|uniref:Adenosine 5'-phosphosulfate reductase n=1 Tax=Jannaschia seohaensis TaxID=475081 RepID=A0A2Y9B523_9RHOB|nr:phosphoadenylyl-sulfate reductase [Jannaschia seohaensis]PWJ10910.1 phosphoadenosine phosphosulfate reductase [Jannaschia seohaensis]SSA51511.1 phosphoadenosine phosphosulfate reductase [Jannaschia seohaensis]
MPLDVHALLTARAAQLNADLAEASAETILDHALRDARLGEVAMVSSFGADSVVLLHLLAQIDPTRPVLFLETGMLFSETLAYQREVAETLGLTDIRVIRPDAADLFMHDPDGELNRVDTDACCAIRKVKPLELSLQGFDAWITGRKRIHGGARASLPLFEVDGPHIKINPLAKWSGAELAAYMERHALPRHPLVANGFTSIGCAPCTTSTLPGEDPRAGRWRASEKAECGIHFDGARIWPASPKTDASL